MKFLKDITNISHKEIFNKAEADLIAAFTNSAEKYTSHGLVIEVDKNKKNTDTFKNLYEKLKKDYNLTNDYKYFSELAVYIEGSYKAIFDGYQLGIRTFICITSCLGYYNRLVQTMANPVTNWAEAKVYLCYYNKETNTFLLEYMIKNNKLQNTDSTLEEIAMNNKKVSVLGNPPFEIGGQITVAVKKVFPAAKYSILMPLAQYKESYDKETQLCNFVKSMTTVGGEGFDASITENNCICTLMELPNKEQTYLDLVYKSFDPNLFEYYMWNIKNSKGLTWQNKVGIRPESLNIKLDFVDGGRCCSKAKGYGYHNKNIDKVGYNYNVLKKLINVWLSEVGYIHFPTAHAKDMFTLFAYNYTTDKYNCLESKALCGCRVTHVGQMYSCMIPQIDWDKIDINQKDLWDNKLYDEAVLAEMGLKWEGDKIVKA